MTEFFYVCLLLQHQRLLKDHCKRSHDGEGGGGRSFPCDTCGTVIMGTQANLRRHIRTQHPNGQQGGGGAKTRGQGGAHRDGSRAGAGADARGEVPEAAGQVETCPVCLNEFNQLRAVWVSHPEACGHRACLGCAEVIMNCFKKTCPECRKPILTYTKLNGTY